MTEPAAPTADQAAAATQVGSDAAAAAAAAPTPEQARADAAAAARATADRVKLEIDDQAVEQIANGVVAMMESRGAFDPPPEPVAAPPAAPPAPTSAEPGPAAPAAPAPDSAPKKRTFAQRFLGET
jgi:hypothetical protein